MKSFETRQFPLFFSSLDPTELSEFFDVLSRHLEPVDEGEDPEDFEIRIREIVSEKRSSMERYTKRPFTVEEMFSSAKEKMERGSNKEAHIDLSDAIFAAEAR